MPRSSRFVRPPDPPPLTLQERDKDLLAALGRYRLCSSDHIHRLVFPELSIKIPQIRLRKLWAHRYIDRFYLPVVLDGERRQSVRPIYALSSKGARVVVEMNGDVTSTSMVGLTPSPAHFVHDLIVTDFLSSIEVAARGRSDVRVTSIQTASTLLRLLGRQTGMRHRHGSLISDGAVTLEFPKTGKHWTYHLEVVRAEVRGGNKNLLEKLKLYAERNHDGYFRKVWGHDNVRAVLVATTSPIRVRNFRELAATMNHGHHLFWFTAFGGDTSSGAPETIFKPDAVFDPMWQETSGDTHSLIPDEARLASSGQPSPA